jgi:hypothetical protein
MALTDTFVRQVKYKGAKAGDKYSDGGGLYLQVSATSQGKQKTLALGVYPDVSLAAARKGRDNDANYWQPGKT